MRNEKPNYLEIPKQRVQFKVRDIENFAGSLVKRDFDILTNEDMKWIMKCDKNFNGIFKLITFSSTKN